ncbi:MAG: Ig-like domain-containing protein [Cyclobacteriaceae bacterium]
MRFRNFLLISLIFLSGCIGVDYFDDPIVDPILSISSTKTSILIGESFEIETTFTNEYGVVESVPITWQSSNVAIAAIVEDKILGVSSGQATIFANYKEILSNGIEITVVGNLNEVATVEITLPDNFNTQLNEGQTVQLTASSFNIEGTKLEREEIAWMSSNDNIASINDTGLLQAISIGTTNITASIDGVTSAPLGFSIGAQVRTGTFQGVGGYKVSGSVLLEVNGDGDLKVVLSEDFEADIALGTFIYLSNSTSGIPTRSGGLELGEITSNGGVAYTVSDVGLNDYQYVVVLCKPASLTFGFSEPK